MRARMQDSNLLLAGKQELTLSGLLRGGEEGRHENKAFRSVIQPRQGTNVPNEISPARRETSRTCRPRLLCSPAPHLPISERVLWSVMSCPLCGLPLWAASKWFMTLERCGCL
jgi:hypothetical protein